MEKSCQTVWLLSQSKNLSKFSIWTIFQDFHHCIVAMVPWRLSYLKLIQEMLMATPKTSKTQIKQTLNRYLANSRKDLTFDCFQRFSPLCTVPCWLSYLKLILEMLMDYYENFHIEIQDYQRAQTPVQRNKQTNKQQSAVSLGLKLHNR